MNFKPISYIQLQLFELAAFVNFKKYKSYRKKVYKCTAYNGNHVETQRQQCAVR